MENALSLPQQIAVFCLPVLFAVTLHEVAHGFVAKMCGDTTAESLGRLSLNPLKHIDPLGTVILPIIMILTSGMVFGWAKPVPVDFGRLRHRKRDMALVALAGPGANLGMAWLWALAGKFAATTSFGWVAEPLAYMAVAGISINVILLVLNLLPIPPLDGSRVVASLLPPRWEYLYSRVEPYGMLIIMALLLTNILSLLLSAPVVALNRWVQVLAGW